MLCGFARIKDRKKFQHQRKKEASYYFSCWQRIYAEQAITLSAGREYMQNIESPAQWDQIFLSYNYEHMQRGYKGLRSTFWWDHWLINDIPPWKLYGWRKYYQQEKQASLINGYHQACRLFLKHSWYLRIIEHSLF